MFGTISTIHCMIRPSQFSPSPKSVEKIFMVAFKKFSIASSNKIQYSQRTLK